MKDLATFKVKPFMPSPFQVFFSYLAPATPTNGQFLPLENYVDLNILVPALFIPRVPATLH